MHQSRDNALLALSRSAIRCSELIEEAARCDGRDGGTSLMRAYAEVEALESALGVQLHMYVSGSRTLVAAAVAAQLMVLGIEAHERADSSALRCQHGLGHCPLRQADAVLKRADVAPALAEYREALSALAHRLLGRFEGQTGYSLEESVARAYGAGPPDGMAADLPAFEFAFGMRLGHAIIMEELQLGETHHEPEPIDARMPDVTVPLFVPEYYRIATGARALCYLLDPPVTTDERGRA